LGRAMLSVLSRDEIERIQDSTLSLLEEVGVVVREPRAAELLETAGCARVGKEGLRIPESVVKEALASAPRAWTFHARDPAHSFRVGDGGRARLGPGSSCTRVVDFETGVARAPTREDGDTLVRLMDALEFADINYTPVMLPEDGTPAPYAEIATLVRDLQNTSKVPVAPSADGREAHWGLEIAAILAGGHEELLKMPVVAGYCDPVGPLIHDRMMTETLMAYASAGQPTFIMCCDLACGSSPATLAGTLLQQNAEILSGIVIAQLVRKGAPVIYGCVSGVLDIRTGSAALGGPEFGLLSAAAVQIAHAYGLPCSVGAQSDAKIHDAQATMEKGMSMLASVSAGADFVDLFFGSYEGFNATSPEQMVLDHDIAGMAFRYTEGIEVTEEALSLDILREVGAGGSFFHGKKVLEHSLRWARKEHYTSFVVDRRARASWEAAGGKKILAAAHERVREILADHRPTPMERDMREAMETVLRQVRISITVV